MKLWLRVRVPLGIYVICAGVYVAMLGARIGGPSPDNHFVHLAMSYLHGQLGVLDNHPPGTNDWACFDTELEDVCASSAFTHTTETQHWYVSFPPVPALIILPVVAIWGDQTRDPLFWALFAGLSPTFLYVLLRELSARGRSTRSERENLTLTALYAFGTVFFFTAVQGAVWFAGHVVACVLLPLYLLFGLDGKRPVAAGSMLALLFMTRPSIAAMVIVFVVEVLRTTRRADAPTIPSRSAHGDDRGGEYSPRARTAAGGAVSRLIPSSDEAGASRRLLAFLRGTAWRETLRKFVPFAVPILIVGCVAMWMNEVRFGHLTEFGHRYLIIAWHSRIERWGIFSYHYLSKNLAIVTSSLPWLTVREPHVIISRHGLALWFTTPALLLTLFPKKRVDAHMVGLYLGVAIVGGWDLLYQNSGWVQFGYRFALDYMALLFVLLAVGGRPFRGGFHLALVFAIVVNTFGALTFDRAWEYYDDDRTQDRVFQPD